MKQFCIPIFLFLTFCNPLLFAQTEPTKTEKAILALIDSSATAIDAGDFGKSANFLERAKKGIDSNASSLILHTYYQNLAVLAFSRFQIAEAQEAYKKSIKAALKLEDTIAIVSAYSGMANSLIVDNKFTLALRYQQDALKLLENNKTKMYYGLLANRAMTYRHMQNFTLALESFLLVKEYFQENEDFKSQAIIENNIGQLYSENIQDFKQAHAHFKRAIVLNKRINEKHQLSQNYHNVSLLFQKENQLDSAFFYIEKSMLLKNEIGDTGGLAISNNTLGTIQMAAGFYDESIVSFKKSLEISEKFGITPGLYYANMGIGKALLAKGKDAEALVNFKKVEEIAKDLESFEMKKEIIKVLFDYYKNRKDFEEALLYGDKLQAISDSISTMQNKENIDELRIQYETSLAENENKILKEKETAQQEKILVQNIFLIILLVALVVFIVLVIVLFKSNRQRKMAYQEVKKATQELEKQYQITKDKEAELFKTVALKDKIFSVLGHDLRTPLANISNLIDSMSQIELSPEEMEFMLKHLKGETNASLKTLENILQWARLQMNDKSILVSELDEDGIIIEIIKNFESNTDAKDIQVKYINKSNAILWADENQFRSIANNLIGNAIKYSPLRGEIEVTFSEERENFVLSISDQGVGISPSVIENLDTQEELISSYGTEGEKGTGIGLRIVKDFVHLHLGKITFAKNNPTGTIVTVYLPKLIKSGMNLN
ncbi:MAG: hypothetical protein AUK33_08840 [Flavobacteriaceae bacterium CG2_30_34_30]|nr:MAG: hypothetical protein AUK33_08840 [Flavobacteriaceae bacterium CG2_30_34_30]PIQ19401.1 MAG: hypothetical protein COW66_01165 [Flavobacteriaceae bacterium CG18_big_fil_WC_8_21_14_2_50_34_36]PIV51031.1 MAG: hypothetical protein COS19_02760 [Flavobacteriaceae bacterium CG02_land_8_20_14_3_00_34_13]PIZ07325.1 MAG: hypothetical protein COY56_09575 [Flavobacteriaceae bacterium CG_4_10_14_0_8_um_filter_34_31]